MSKLLMILGLDFLTLIQEWANQRLADGGPRYTEYHPEQIIVEPWNALSSVIMMLPAIYWLWRYRKSASKNLFFLFAISMVFLGGLGSTLYHAFRMSSVFLILDILPSALLMLALAIYFWIKVLPKWWYIFLIFVPVFALRVLLFNRLGGHLSINLSYAISGLLVLLPLGIVLKRTDFKGLTAMVIVLFAFAIALLFRQLDVYYFPFLPQGTHFLWHLFSAIGSFSMLWYLFVLNKISTKRKKKQDA